MDSKTERWDTHRLDSTEIVQAYMLSLRKENWLKSIRTERFSISGVYAQFLSINVYDSARK
jgi:hypothetical protein